jgi:hypothetical protein
MPFVPGFSPSLSGFHFANKWNHVPLLNIDVAGVTVPIGDASNGLCGGMVYAAADYFLANSPPAPNASPPGPVYDYLVARLFDSFRLGQMPPGPARYMHLMDPALPDHETDASRAGIAPHGRAWVMIVDEWPQIRKDLDRERLSPLGLIRVKTLDPFRMGKNHQVLAYGYDLQGTDLTLHIYDPNHPNDDQVTISLSIADPQHTTTVAQSTGEKVFCFFRTGYRSATPPPVDQGPPLPSDEIPWIDDEIPTGASIDGDPDEWAWTSAYLPRSGRAAHISIQSSGIHAHGIIGAQERMRVETGDRLFTYAYIDSQAKPDELMLEWHDATDGSWEHRAFWGKDAIEVGAPGTSGRRKAGSLPAPDNWARLEIPAADVGLEGRIVDGMRFVAHEGLAVWDRAGRIGRNARLATRAHRTGRRGLAALCNPGAAWSPRPVADVAHDIRQAGLEYFAAPPGRNATKVIAARHGSRFILRAAPDRSKRNNLQDLPPC